MLISLLTILPIAWATECDALQTIPEAIQVAWVSPVSDTVRPNQQIEVVHLQSLQGWLTETESNATEVLQHLGMVSERAKDVNPMKYKVTILDVESVSLCRPVQVYEGDSLEIAGLPVCSAGKTRPSQLYTRYGQDVDIQNTSTQKRGFDVYRVT